MDVEEESEQEQHKKHLLEVAKTGEDLLSSLDLLNKKVSSGSDPNDGISFLSFKNELLLEYNMNLAYLMLKKTKGKSIEGDKAVDRLCYLRTVLEKIRPIEHKLKYQIDKFVSIAETGPGDNKSQDPLRLKANPSLLTGNEDEDGEDSEEEDDEASTGKDNKSDAKYVAPRNVPQHFEGDKSKEEVEAESEKRRKKSALSASMMRELKSQLWDTPEEISHQADTRKQKYIQEQKEKERYEEDNFMRLPITKAERLASKQFSTSANIGDGLTNFGFNNFDGKETRSSNSGKKRKHSDKKGKSKKFKKFKK